MYRAEDRAGLLPAHARLRAVRREDAVHRAWSLPLTATETAVLRTLAYADVFDFPLDRNEVFRYCVSPGGTRREVDAAIDQLLERGRICTVGRHLFLPGREITVFCRRSLAPPSRRAWRTAHRWGRVLWALPFVRMVAVTGSLAVESKRADQDIDFLVVAAPNRLWLTRGLCLLVWRVARLLGVRLCPNYLVTTRALAVGQRDLYTARELVQMVPLHGRDVACRFGETNRWSLDFLPNARVDAAGASDTQSPPARAFKRWAERLLAGPPADRLEGWERRRKVARLEAAGTGESLFTADVCKDHGHAHGRRVLDEYALRLAALDQLEDEEPAPAGERLAAAN